MRASPIAYLGKDSNGGLTFAGTAILTLAGKPRDELQKRIEKLVTTKPPVPQRTWRKPQWLKPEVRVKVRHLAGGDTLRHGTVKGLVGKRLNGSRSPSRPRPTYDPRGESWTLLETKADTGPNQPGVIQFCKVAGVGITCEPAGILIVIEIEPQTF